MTKTKKSKKNDAKSVSRAPKASKIVKKAVAVVKRVKKALRKPAMQGKKKTVAVAVVRKAPAKGFAGKQVAKKPVSRKAAAPSAAEKAPKSLPPKKLGAAEKRALEKMLLEMREHFSKQVEFLKTSSLERTDSVNPAEDGTDAFDRQFALAIAGSEQESLAAIDEALERLQADDYGFCESCGESIALSRLKAVPFVKMCVKCKAKAEGSRPRRILL